MVNGIYSPHHGMVNGTRSPVPPQFASLTLEAEKRKKACGHFPDGRGNDYRGRAIRVVQIGFWQYDHGTEEYVSRN